MNIPSKPHVIVNCQRNLSQGGFTVVQMMIVVAIIGLVSAFALLGVARSRHSIRLQNSARTFAGYVEKARLDAIRRHDGTNINVTGPNTYSITMDFDGTGVVVERSFKLENDVVFTDSTNTAYTVDASGNVTSSNGEAVSWADFNWRGRTAQCSMLFRMQNKNAQGSVVQVAGSGDVTIDTSVTTPAAATTTTVNPTADVTSSAVVSGTLPQFELNPCSVSGGSGTVIPPPSSTCAGGSISPDVGAVTVRKNGGSTATVTITVTGPGTIVSAPNSNLQVTPATQSVTSSSGGTFAFAISSKTRVRASNPPFLVTFSNPCSSFPIYVTVTN